MRTTPLTSFIDMIPPKRLARVDIIRKGSKLRLSCSCSSLQIALSALASGAVVHDLVAEDVAVEAEEAMASFTFVAAAFAEAGLGALFLLMGMLSASLSLDEEYWVIRRHSIA